MVIRLGVEELFHNLHLCLSAACMLAILMITPPSAASCHERLARSDVSVDRQQDTHLIDEMGVLVAAANLLSI